MLGERSGDETRSVSERTNIAGRVAPDDRASALDFALLVRSLIADARFAVGSDSPIERR